MYMAGPITFRFPDNSDHVLTDISQLNDFLNVQHGIPKRTDNTNYNRSQILGGELFDGCPVDVILNDGHWSQAELDAIKNDPAVAAAVSSCKYYPAVTPIATAPASGSTSAPPNVTQVEAPGYTNPPVTPSGTPKLPTGIATPTVQNPTVIVTGGGSSPVDSSAPGGNENPTLEAGMSPLEIALLAGLGISLIFGRKK